MITNLLTTLIEIADYIFYIVIALLILMLMITIHELGHYIAGKILKFKINEFSIGFGKAIYTKKTKSGEQFSVRLIPLGGYCAFDGEDSTEDIPKQKPKEEQNNDNNDAKKAQENTSNDFTNSSNGASNSEKSSTANESAINPSLTEIQETTNNTLSFNEQAPWKRIIVLFSGVFFNFISAILFSIILLVAFGYDIPEIKSVSNESPNAHLMAGDIIKSVEGTKVDYIYGKTLNVLLAEFDGDEISIVILRQGEEFATSLYRQTIIQEEKEIATIGLTIGAYRHNLGEALARCVPLTLMFAWKILEFLALLITGQVALSSVTGPVTTITTIATFAQQSFANLFVFLPFISVNLAIFNILPIPALDGSKILFTSIEWIRGKPINRRVENAIHFGGLILLLGFVVIVDVLHIFL